MTPKSITVARHWQCGKIFTLVPWPPLMKLHMPKVEGDWNRQGYQMWLRATVGGSRPWVTHICHLTALMIKIADQHHTLWHPPLRAASLTSKNSCLHRLPVDYGPPTHSRPSQLSRQHSLKISYLHHPLAVPIPTNNDHDNHAVAPTMTGWHTIDMHSYADEENWELADGMSLTCGPSMYGSWYLLRAPHNQPRRLTGYDPHSEVPSTCKIIEVYLCVLHSITKFNFLDGMSRLMSWHRTSARLKKT